MRKHTIKNMEQIAKKRGFAFMSDEYLGSLVKHDWMCSMGHVWSAKPASIVNGVKCPKCPYPRLRKTVDDIRELAKSRGFQLISHKFIGMRRKHLWQCPDGHQWLAAPANIKITGCPKCSGGIREEQSRFIFESLLGYKFPKNRSVLGGTELDGYCEDIMLAFEYNGVQHYKQHYLNRGKLKEIQKRDVAKSLRCRELGIIKIDIPYTKSGNLEHFIRTQLEALKYRIQGDVDWSKFIGKPSRLKGLKQIAKDRDGVLITNQYLGSHEKHEWKCNKCSTNWRAIAKDVVSGGWCPTCANNQKYTIDKVQNIAECAGWTMVSPEYYGMNYIHKFRCVFCGDACETKPNKIQQGKICKCRKEVKKECQ